MNDEFWFGEDIHGNMYSVFVDKSPNDFWIETTIQKTKQGEYVVWSCDIVSKKEDKPKQIDADT